MIIKPCKISIVVFLVVSIVVNVSAQDPQFSQFYATPLYLNPAFTGNTIEGRMAGVFRDQWPKIPGAFISYAFSYDHYVRKINSGLGLMFIRDKAGSAGLRFTKIAASYAYIANLSRRLSFRAGLRFAYATRTLDQSKLIFGSQLTQNESAGVPIPPFQKVWYFDTGAGAVLYSHNFWFGISSDHLNQPKLSLVGLNYRLPMKYSAHGGYVHPLTRNAKKKITSTLVIAANYKAQDKWDQTDLGVYYKKEPVVFGLWYRGIPFLKRNPGKSSSYVNQDALVFMLGLHVRDFRIGYSYDATISKLIGSSGGAHEITIIYEYVGHKKSLTRSKFFVVPCAKF